MQIAEGEPFEVDDVDICFFAYSDMTPIVEAKELRISAGGSVDHLSKRDRLAPASITCPVRQLIGGIDGIKNERNMRASVRCV